MGIGLLANLCFASGHSHFPTTSDLSKSDHVANDTKDALCSSTSHPCTSYRFEPGRRYNTCRDMLRLHKIESVLSSHTATPCSNSQTAERTRIQRPHQTTLLRSRRSAPASEAATTTVFGEFVSCFAWRMGYAIVKSKLSSNIGVDSIRFTRLHTVKAYLEGLAAPAK